jgi:hypothetical protein
MLWKLLNSFLRADVLEIVFLQFDAPKLGCALYSRPPSIPANNVNIHLLRCFKFLFGTNPIWLLLRQVKLFFVKAGLQMRLEPIKKAHLREIRYPNEKWPEN